MPPTLVLKFFEKFVYFRKFAIQIILATRYQNTDAKKKVKQKYKTCRSKYFKRINNIHNDKLISQTRKTFIYYVA